MEFYKKGFSKYIPEFLLPKIKPKIIEDILKEDKVIGKIVGINLKPMDLNNQENLDKFLEALLELKYEDSNTLFIEGYENLSSLTLESIQDITKMKIFNGEYTRLSNILVVIRKIFSILKEDLEDKEILVVCDEKEIAKRIIKEISKGFRFITSIGCEEYNDEIYEYILEETGLSLFYPINIHKILSRYSVIINYTEKLEFDISKAKRNAIVFNFSKIDLKDNKNRTHFIEDYGFDFKELGIKTEWINHKITSSLFESLLGMENHSINYLISGNNYYSLKDYVNLFIKVKGRF